MRTRWFVEWDAHCQNVLRRHWPGLPVYGDITSVDWGTVEPVDVLAGGFPCQPVSNAGKRLGTDDERWLWPAFADAIRALEPRYVLVENVAALLGRGFEHVITDLAALGYDAEWDCIPAAAVGAPHLRDRLWIAAYASRYGRSWSRTGHSRRDDPPQGGKRFRTEPAGSRTGHAALAHAERSSTQPVGEPGDVPRSSGSAQGTSPQRQRRGNAAGDRGQVVAHADAVGRRASFRDDDARESHTARCRQDVADADAGGRDGRSGEQRSRGRRQPPNRRQPLADATSIGRSEGRAESARQQGRPGTPASGPAVSDAIFAGLEGHERGVVALTDYRRSNADPAGSGWWATEPDVGRVADGVPHRVDRLRALGNAVVPQVVEWIGRRIVAFDATR